MERIWNTLFTLLLKTEWTPGGEDTGPQPGDHRANDSTFDQIADYFNQNQSVFSLIFSVFAVIGVFLLIGFLIVKYKDRSR